MGQSCSQTKQNRLPDRSSHGNDKSGHHGFGMAWFKPMQRAQQNGAGNKQPKVLTAGLDEACEIDHVDTLWTRLVGCNGLQQKTLPFGERFVKSINKVAFSQGNGDGFSDRERR
jgi:hypothetical protein